jgi:hypothetical protein
MIRAWLAFGLVLGGCGGDPKGAGEGGDTGHGADADTDTDTDSDTDTDTDSDSDVDAEPSMSVDTDNLDFGELDCGIAATEQVAVRNDGEAPLQVTALVLDGLDFQLDAPAPPFSIEPGDEQLLDLTLFLDRGDGAGTLTIQGDDSDNPEHHVGLTGSCTSAVLELGTSNIFFGNHQPGCTSREEVILTSAGNRALTIESLNVLGDAFSLEDNPALPVVLEPGDSATVVVGFRPGDLGGFAGELEVGSDDPLSSGSVLLEGRGSDTAPCGDILPAEISLVAEHDAADVAVLIDTTCSMSATLGAFQTEVVNLASDLSDTLSDISFGVATYDDYNYEGLGEGEDRPFILRQQQTHDFLSVEGVLRDDVSLHSGVDSPESGHEALYQLATGLGYDQNCDGYNTRETDVPPFLPTPLDAFGGIEAGKGDPGGIGILGGMGFRDGVQPVVIIATDNELRDPELGFVSPGGCPMDAGYTEAVDALNELGAKVIGVSVSAWGYAAGRDQLAAIAEGTGTLVDIDGDLVLEPLVIDWISDPALLRMLLTAGVEGALAFDHFDLIEVRVASDPGGRIDSLSPDRFIDVAAGTRLDLTMEVAGELVDIPGAGTEELILELVADGRFVIKRQTFHVLP